MEDAPPPEDRRRSPRVPAALRHEYTHLNAFFSDFTQNLGRGGTFLRTEDPLPIGTECTFSVVVPGLNEPLVLRGRVHWRVTKETAFEGQEPGMGIGFVYESEAERARVEATVERLMEESLGALVSGKLMERIRR